MAATGCVAPKARVAQTRRPRRTRPARARPDEQLRELARVLEYREDLWDDGLDPGQYAVGDEPARPRDSEQGEEQEDDDGQGGDQGHRRREGGPRAGAGEDAGDDEQDEVRGELGQLGDPDTRSATAGSAPAFWSSGC